MQSTTPTTPIGRRTPLRRERSPDRESPTFHKGKRSTTQQLVAGIFDRTRSQNLRVLDGVTLAVYILTCIAVYDLGCMLFEKFVAETKYSIDQKGANLKPLQNRLVTQVNGAIKSAVKSKLIVFMDRFMNHSKIKRLIEESTAFIISEVRLKVAELQSDEDITAALTRAMESEPIKKALKKFQEEAMTGVHKALGTYEDPNLPPLPKGPKASDIDEAKIRQAARELADNFFGRKEPEEKEEQAGDAASAAESKGSEDSEGESVTAKIEEAAPEIVRRMIAQALGILPPTPTRPKVSGVIQPGMIHDPRFQRSVDNFSGAIGNGFADSVSKSYGVMRIEEGSPLDRIEEAVTQAIYATIARAYKLPVTPKKKITVPELAKGVAWDTVKRNPGKTALYGGALLTAPCNPITYAALVRELF